MNELSNYSVLMDEVEEPHLLEKTKILERMKSFFTNKKSKTPQIATFAKKDGILEIKNVKRSENIFKSQKYNIFTFVPLVIFEQFRIFYNFYFLLMSIAYLYPPLRMGVWWTSWMPITFFLAISFFKEGFEDYQRKKRDEEVNNAIYERIGSNGKVENVRSKDILPGDIIVLHSGQRVPADSILFGTDGKNDGSIFIKTDQLDGETDWKLRKSVPLLRNYNYVDFANIDDFQISATTPSKGIDDFSGTFKLKSKLDPLSLDNTLWASTVLASRTAIVYVIYTGQNTKFALNAEKAPFKISLFEEEANNFAKMLFVLQLIAGIALGLSYGLSSATFQHILQFVLLLSYILPVSLRVNLDMGKSFYSRQINKDVEISPTTVRNVNVCEELGRVSYVLTDKTGTLTLNQMNFKKLKTAQKTLNEAKICHLCSEPNFCSSQSREPRLLETMEAVALCHNVTPSPENSEDGSREISYQGSSSDEIALVEFAARSGFRLVERDSERIVITNPSGAKQVFAIKKMFPFSASSKRMGILLERSGTGEILFLSKGAEEAISPFLRGSSDAVLEDVADLAAEGLRTLVFAAKAMSASRLRAFEDDYEKAVAALDGESDYGGRDELTRRAVADHLECEMEVLGVTGVEDKLRNDVKHTIELMRQAGIKVWMLTGDKMETAECVGKAIGMLSRATNVIRIGDRSVRSEMLKNLAKVRAGENLGKEGNWVLVVNGSTMGACLDADENSFIELSMLMEGVIICRSSPTQKAQIARLLQKHAKKRVCAVGDGGNDVGMISVADVGIGIEGREGKSAALAADVATEQFSSLGRLLLWHGRNSYLRSASLAHLIFHRGVIVAVMQGIFSGLIGFKPKPLFTGWLIIGYTTVYTSLPVFSLVLDRDYSEKDVMLFPQFYAYLQNEGTFSFKVFLSWLAISTYQGAAIILVTYGLYQTKFNFNAVTVAFTALIFSELLNIALSIKTWNLMIALSLIISATIYSVSLFVLSNIFDEEFVHSEMFVVKSLLATVCSCLPVIIWKVISQRIHVSDNRKTDFGDK